MSVWHGGFVDWTEGQVAKLSVVFSWQMQKAYQRAVWYHSMGYEVWAGGPAVEYRPQFLEGVARIGMAEDSALERHNAEATFTERGCIRRCSFCIVPKIRPHYEELTDWPVKPIICDDNFLAASPAHFDSVIDKLKPLKGVDFNQGLDARLLTKRHAERLRELDMKVVRLAWDSTGIEQQYRDSFALLRGAGFPAGMIRTYVLIGFKDTPDDALYRLQAVKDLGAWPNPMRFQPLDADFGDVCVQQVDCPRAGVTRPQGREGLHPPQLRVLCRPRRVPRGEGQRRQALRHPEARVWSCAGL